MHIERFVCTQWRNLSDQKIEFSPGVNLLIGDNGQGKTNILEVIHFFKFGRSFQTRRDGEVIRFGEPFCRSEVSCVFNDGARETFAAAIESNGTKKIRRSGKEVPRLSKLLGRYPCVLFGPQDLSIVSGEPALRRRFVDAVGSMTGQDYVRSAREYQRVLRQRNAALKARAGDEELNAWNERIVESGTELMQRRAALVETLAREVRFHAGEMDLTREVTISYHSPLMREAERITGSGANGDIAPSLADVFAIKLGALEQEERRRMTTLAGPHRDDVTMELAGKDLRSYGSQGQRRLFAILLKLAELSHLERELGERCVLLLDDVFSEFDHPMTHRLQGLLEGARQVFITSPVALDWLGEGTVFSVHGGTVGRRNPA